VQEIKILLGVFSFLYVLVVEVLTEVWLFYMYYNCTFTYFNYYLMPDFTIFYNKLTALIIRYLNADKYSVDILSGGKWSEVGNFG